MTFESEKNEYTINDIIQENNIKQLTLKLNQYKQELHEINIELDRLSSEFDCDVDPTQAAISRLRSLVGFSTRTEVFKSLLFSYGLSDYEGKRIVNYLLHQISLNKLDESQVEEELLNQLKNNPNSVPRSEKVYNIDSKEHMLSSHQIDNELDRLSSEFDCDVDPTQAAISRLRSLVGFSTRTKVFKSLLFSYGLSDYEGKRIVNYLLHQISLNKLDESQVEEELLNQVKNNPNAVPKIKKGQNIELKNIRNISLNTRIEIFERDNYTCQICGRNTKEDDVKLEIDHIIPVSKGGSDDRDNLQTLCFECNRGKSDKILHNQFKK